MKRIFLRLKQPLRNERGEITFFACFFVVGIVMLISFLLLYASIRITCINIRNGAKMELNNLSGTIYADTYRSQRETNFEEYPCFGHSTDHTFRRKNSPHFQTAHEPPGDSLSHLSRRPQPAPPAEALHSKDFLWTSPHILFFQNGYRFYNPHPGNTVLRSAPANEPKE